MKKPKLRALIFTHHGSSHSWSLQGRNGRRVAMSTALYTRRRDAIRGLDSLLQALGVKLRSVIVEFHDETQEN